MQVPNEVVDILQTDGQSQMAPTLHRLRIQVRAFIIASYVHDRARPDRGAHGIEIGGVHQADLHAELVGQVVTQQPVHRDVGDVRADDVRTGTQEGEEDSVQSRDTGGEHDCLLTALERRELLLQLKLVGP